MFLEKITIKNFRSIQLLDINFNKGVNIIIGENNSGKSAVIDALRICLGQGRQYRDIGIRNDEDFHVCPNDINRAMAPIEFNVQFKIEEHVDAVYFNSMIYQDPADPTYQDIRLNIRYELQDNNHGSKNLKWKLWGGNIEGTAPDPNELQLLYYTYLAPLRNAETELRPYARDNKVTSLFREMTAYQSMVDGAEVQKPLSKSEKDALVGKLQSVVMTEGWADLIKTGEKFVNHHLNKADIRNKSSLIIM